MESGGDVSRGLNPFGRSPWQRREIAHKNETMKNALVPKDLESHFNLENGPSNRRQTGLNRLLKSILDETGQKPSALDRENYSALVSNMKALVFAGFDTTASMLCWIFKLLQDNPNCFAKMRAEHEKILGKDPDNAPAVLSESPHLLNSLPYTNAILKETLRLYPISFAIRQGTPGKYPPRLVFVQLHALLDYLHLTAKDPGLTGYRFLSHHPRLEHQVPDGRLRCMGCRWAYPAGPQSLGAS